jgi:peptide/nickel transport system substrate-binding protein
MQYWRLPEKEAATPWEAEVDDLFRRGREAADDRTRRDLYRRFQEIAAEQIPLIFTVQRVLTVAIRSRVEGFDPSPAGHFHNIALIDVARE